MIISLLLFLKIDILADKIISLLEECKIKRLSIKRGMPIKYVQQGWHSPIIACSNGIGKFKIGKCSSLKSDTYIECMGDVIIGDYFHTGRGLTIFSANHEYDKGSAIPYGEEVELKEVVIGSWVWCGANVTITPGVHIGDGAVIGSGAVVTKDVPECAVVGGNPARIIKYRDKESFYKKKAECKYN